MKAKKPEHKSKPKKKFSSPIKKHHLSHPGLLFLGSLLVAGVVGWLITYAFRYELYEFVMSRIN